MKKSRQVMRQEARRSNKPDAGTVSRTSIKWMGRKTKGLPYSRSKVISIVPSSSGRPARFFFGSHTRKSFTHVEATPSIIDVVFPNLPENMKAAMMGRY